MISFIRVWWNTRWFMKHWRVNKPFARHCALVRERYLKERS